LRYDRLQFKASRGIFRGIYGILVSALIKNKTRKMSTCKLVGVGNNVRGELAFSVMAAGWFCGKSS